MNNSRYSGARRSTANNSRYSGVRRSTNNSSLKIKVFKHQLVQFQDIGNREIVVTFVNKFFDSELRDSLLKSFSAERIDIPQPPKLGVKPHKGPKYTFKVAKKHYSKILDIVKSFMKFSDESISDIDQISELKTQYFNILTSPIKEFFQYKVFSLTRHFPIRVEHHYLNSVEAKYTLDNLKFKIKRNINLSEDS